MHVWKTTGPNSTADTNGLLQYSTFISNHGFLPLSLIPIFSNLFLASSPTIYDPRFYLCHLNETTSLITFVFAKERCVGIRQHLSAVPSTTVLPCSVESLLCPPFSVLVVSPPNSCGWLERLFKLKLLGYLIYHKNGQSLFLILR